MGVNWKEVDPTDFEKITRDLLTREFNTQIESFAAGPDGGIDLRADNGTTIIQCKRITTDFSSLRSKLKEEAKKEAVRAAKRYVVVTCVDLTPQNKEEIRALFPNIHTPEDILGGGELEGLIAKHKEIRNLYPALWLGDIKGIYKSINKSANNSIYESSRFEYEQILKELPYIAPPKWRKEAIEILEKNKALIITGHPGIGKTTLARYLIGYLISTYKYRLVAIDKDISSAYQVYNDEECQVFLYDDFLGSNFIRDGLDKNEDRRIVNFIKKIKLSKNKLAIFTTREYIYKQADQYYPNFSDNDIINKITINIDQEDIVYKASIFCKHLSKEKIPFSIIEKLFLNSYNKRWGSGCHIEQILKNKRFNPRIIASSISGFNSSQNKEEIYTLIIENLNHPYKLYYKPFTQQLSENEQALLLCLGTFPDQVSQQKLYTAWSSFIGEKLHRATPIESVYNVLLGDFITSSISPLREVQFSFINPGVRDFIYRYYNNNRSIIGNLIVQSCYTEQLLHIYRTFNSFNNNALADILPIIYKQSIFIIECNCAGRTISGADFEMIDILQKHYDVQLSILETMMSAEASKAYSHISTLNCDYFINVAQVLFINEKAIPFVNNFISALFNNVHNSDVLCVFDELKELMDSIDTNDQDILQATSKWQEEYFNYIQSLDTEALNSENNTIINLIDDYPSGYSSIDFNECFQAIQDRITEIEFERRDSEEYIDYGSSSMGNGALHAANFPAGKHECSLPPQIIRMFEDLNR